ncbi:uncharacterized protein [Equus asinus]|uniref:uncharacterized protein n=1 Tax=Equus asinus TaxID=9793 RepID=UPI0038F7EEE4
MAGRGRGPGPGAGSRERARSERPGGRGEARAPRGGGSGHPGQAALKVTSPRQPQRHLGRRSGGPGRGARRGRGAAGRGRGRGRERSGRGARRAGLAPSPRPPPSAAHSRFSPGDERLVSRDSGHRDVATPHAGCLDQRVLEEFLPSRRLSLFNGDAAQRDQLPSNGNNAENCGPRHSRNPDTSTTKYKASPSPGAHSQPRSGPSSSSFNVLSSVYGCDLREDRLRGGAALHKRNLLLSVGVLRKFPHFFTCGKLPPSFSFIYHVYSHEEFKKCDTVNFIRPSLSASGFCIQRCPGLLRAVFFIPRS